MNRDQKFGKLLAIANVISGRVFEGGKPTIAQKHMARFSKKPAYSFERIHAEIMEYAPKFQAREMELLNKFQEILADMDESEFNNQELSPQYLHAYYSEQKALSN
ncbi:type I-C CRISPR-associated protein Cas8c/Csd1 [Virgibacillus proomii]|uniref:type I-C CRISPR-associated protein Cas8c/Csd1 n=1 Tax=Virgibacillus proomii TaxID=84407 RepID=UPI001C112092|nr:type I-C CRISPR-associated protein Cas8c/Csd1 [Virgibacillus proomii]MBU5266276.1 type I-C CRISPR-associated protein Cas8c/Csd1 [Virgibacillus proomii]